MVNSALLFIKQEHLLSGGHAAGLGTCYTSGRSCSVESTHTCTTSQHTQFCPAQIA